MITIALSKGRILKQSLPLLKKIGITIDEEEINSRKLILKTNNNNINIIIIRPTDVPVFIQHGAADIGIVGKDVLLEHGSKNIIEILDLNIAKCRLMVAAKSEADLNQKSIKIATKYVNSAKVFFNTTGQDYEIIKLYGAMELAPIVGMSDIIVDLVDTGNTLKANNLIPLRHICDISSRLIINNASFVNKNIDIQKLVTDFTNLLSNNSN